MLCPPSQQRQPDGRGWASSQNEDYYRQSHGHSTYFPTVLAANDTPRTPVLEDSVHDHRLLGDVVVDPEKEWEWPQLSWTPSPRPHAILLTGPGPSCLSRGTEMTMSSVCAAPIPLPSAQGQASALPAWMILTVSQRSSPPHPSSPFYPHPHPPLYFQHQSDLLKM